MKRNKYIPGLLAVLLLPLLYACEVKEEDLPIPPDTETPVVLDSLELLASSPQLQSDGSTTVTLTALAKDTNNQVVEGVPILFSATSGSLTVLEGETTAQGAATAELRTGGDPTNRDITVTATGGADAAGAALTDTVTIDVIGTSLQIQGPTSLVNGDSGDYTVTLANSAGVGIANRTIDLSSANGNTLSAATLTTDSSGRVQVTLTGNNAGTDTLTASALPDSAGTPTVSASAGISVSSDNFRFTTPTSGTEVDLNTPRTVTVRWEKNGVAQENQPIRFATTRGTLSGGSVSGNTDATDASGDASVQISSTTSGTAVITATNPDGTATQRSIEFVATNPDSVSLQAEPAVIGVSETSTITAVVQDPANNRVKNATVEFTLEDNTGGTLSTASAVTDSQGRAQTVYTANSVTSADDGVVVTGEVVGGSNPSASTTLTVSGRALFINFGTGNTIVEDETDTRYIKDYVVLVTDSSGKGVAGQNVTISALPDIYRKGYMVLDAVTNIFVPEVESICTNEDLNRNGVLDVGEDQNLAQFPEDAAGNNNGILDGGEDLNGNGALDSDPGWQTIEAGNRALVTPGTVTTDEDGLAEFQLIYPQDHAQWLDVIITAKASVSGTESQRSQRVQLPVAAADVSASGSPPNNPSPFGSDYLFQFNCNDINSNTQFY